MTRLFALRYHVLGIIWLMMLAGWRNPFRAILWFAMSVLGTVVCIFAPMRLIDDIVRGQIDRSQLLVRRGDMPCPPAWIARTILTQPPARPAWGQR